ncbi:uncharacterized protein LY89DRAFT_752108 [Mollisia scopiformis]|uniref:Rhodopsin domain-containing protein n=1 Tax=Mollisia scopiformis TaxID=149040 RepID=A0A194X224_MOLSC|nr:uncharacterized protein LY89DRAFT_752108 [Mollisia scopiformis]KUJ14246.1 hypothetical protein LY89DRAFT_752108 [Mollisia scopiformis]
MASSGIIEITSDARGSWINIATWILMVIMCLASFVKLFSKWVIARTFGLDDLFMAIATVITIAYDIAVSMQVAAGLGQHQSTLSGHNILRYQKVLLPLFTRPLSVTAMQAEYASQLLMTASLCVAKMVLLHFYAVLGRHDIRLKVIKSVIVLNVVAYAMLLLCLAFQCGIPNPWEMFSGKCFDQVVFWDAFTVIDIFLDVCTICLPIYLLHDIKLRRSQKFYTIAAFGSRTLLIPVSVIRIIYIHDNSKSVDHTYQDFAIILTTSFLINLSVIVTAIPFLKPIMDSLQTGILAGDLRSMGGSALLRSTSYPLGRHKRKSTPHKGGGTRISDQTGTVGPQGIGCESPEIGSAESFSAV